MDEIWLYLISTLASTLRLSAPLILCAMAGIFSERSGIIDIGLEGKMLIAAFASASAAYSFDSAWLGLLFGIVAASCFALIHGFACITNRGDQVISGLALNVLASGVTVVLGIAWYSQGGRTPSLDQEQRFSPLHWPLAETMQDVPIIGTVYSNLISGHNLLLYLAFLAVPLSWWLLWRTRFGLRLRSVGENPAAADTAGISVIWLRYRAMLLCGLLTGVAGSYLAIAQNASFVKNMSAGQGYIALAAMIFGKWRPKTAMLACLLFGFLDALAARMQGVVIPLIDREIPVQMIQALPYILTVVLLAGFIGKAVAPKAIGQPYVKQH